MRSSLRKALALPALLALSLAVCAESPKPDSPTDPISDLQLPKGAKAEYKNLECGYTFEWGAFDLGATPEGLLITEAKFPDRAKFVRLALTYEKPYTDPKVPQYTGELFSCTLNGNKRFFLFGTKDLGADLRWLVQYNEKGQVLHRWKAHFAKQ